MSVSLNEQMGAMTLVDQLRHREMEIQEHLDLPRRRIEVAERIRAYYQNNGIIFDDAVIDEGVRQFFSRRLQFEAPALSRPQRVLSRLFMGRAKLVNYTAAALVSLFMALFAHWQMETKVDAKAERLMADSQTLQDAIATQRLRLEQTKLRLKRQPNATVERLLAKAEPLLPSAAPAVNLNPADFADRDAFKAQLARAQITLSNTRQNLDSVRKRLNRIDHLYASLEQQQQLLARLLGMHLASPEHQEMADWIDKAGEQIASLRLEKADKTLKNVESYLNYASQPLTLALVDRPGTQSGVERCYEPSGCSKGSSRGKSWYLIVEALDSAGNPVYVPVTSVEDNQARWTKVFGVRVSRDEYRRVRQDKLDDGHISQRYIGEKAANSLELRFSQRTSANPDMILEW